VIFKSLSSIILVNLILWRPFMILSFLSFTLLMLTTMVPMLCANDKPLQIQWDNTYGADKEDKAFGIVSTRDDGIVIVGTSRSFSKGKEDLYLLKTDAKGKLLWEKRLGKNRKDTGSAIAEDKEGALYVVGTSKSFSQEGDYDVYALKLDKDGNTLWSKSLGGTNKDQGYGITITQDGGVAIVGKTKSFGHGHYDAYMIKLDTNGKILWSNAFGGISNEEAHDVTELIEGSLIVVGGTQTFGAGDFDFYLIKVSADGKKLWEKFYGEKKADIFHCVTANKDGGFTTAGYTRSYQSQKKDLTVMRCDKEGNTLWHKIIGRHYHEVANGIATTPNDGVIVVGSTKSMGHGKEDLYILDIIKEGEVTWAKPFGGKKNDIAHAIAPTKDGGYVIAGESESFGESDNYDVYLMKMKR